MFDLNIEIKINLDKSKLKKPILIAGLPGMGLTGKQAVDYLIESLNAFKISEIKTPFLTAPAITTHDGIVDDMMSEIYTLYYAKSGDLDLILFTGATQPPSAEWQHLLSYRIVEELSKYALQNNIRHKIILMVELGDLREGIMPEVLLDTVKKVKKMI